MFVSVKFSPADAREYTYLHEGPEPVIVGDIGTVITKDGKKDVVVANVDLPKPPFPCKPISFASAPKLPPKTHNNPPDPIDEAIAPFSEYIVEAQNWLDGEQVTTEDQMKAVDVLIKNVRSAKTALAKAKKSATAPLHDIWKAEIARWKPTEDDIDMRLKGLAKIVDPFKRKLAEEKEAAKRAAYAEAHRIEREAEDAARKADATDYKAAAEAARLKEQAIEAKKAASAANKDTVKGLHTVQKYEIEDHRIALNWIAVNHRDAVTAFIEEFVRANHRKLDIAGVKQWSEKEAY